MTTETATRVLERQIASIERRIKVVQGLQRCSLYIRRTKLQAKLAKLLRGQEGETIK